MTRASMRRGGRGEEVGGRPELPAVGGSVLAADPLPGVIAPAPEAAGPPGPDRVESLHPAVRPARPAGRTARLGRRVQAGWRWLLVRWRQSLQVRVATTTVLASGLVVVVLGLLLISRITAGVLDAKRKTAIAETKRGQSVVQEQLSLVNDASPDSLRLSLRALAANLSNQGNSAGLFSIVMQPENGTAFSSGDAEPGNISLGLRQLVQGGHLTEQYAQVGPAGRTGPGLIVGAPITVPIGTFELYYIFPLQNEQHDIALIQQTVLIIGVLLVLLLAIIALLVTRQVVRPVRVAAQTAERLAAGRLEERMQVRGQDDLALLGAAFNDMAASMQRQIRKLEDMSWLQRRFTSDVSHELRTPLTTVRMAADVLHAARGDFSPEVGRSAELLQAELDRFEELLADLLEISRHDAQVALLEPEPIDLRGLLLTVLAATAAIVEEQGSVVRTDLPDRPVVAEVDPRRVTRILRNLVVNAAEHGEGRPIDVVLRGNDSAVAIAVRDHGVGLRAGEAALVFDRFWRADPSRARTIGGTGLGLAISREDAILHGGWLQAWGSHGEGSQFRLSLPRVAGAVLRGSPLPLVPPEVEMRRTWRGHITPVLSPAAADGGRDAD
jgi:two-component system, OmpR family, sensor histidine kinase MtrB